VGSVGSVGSKPDVARSKRGIAGSPSSGHGCGPDGDWPTVAVYLKRLGSPPASPYRAWGRAWDPAWDRVLGRRSGPAGRPARRPAACPAGRASPGAADLFSRPGGGPLSRPGGERRPSNSYPGTLPASPGGGGSPSGNRDAASCGRRGRVRPGGSHASSASGLPAGSLVTCALPSSHVQKGLHGPR
jgi:hypothetical protein